MPNKLLQDSNFLAIYIQETISLYDNLLRVKWLLVIKTLKGHTFTY